jgi:AcrR family transcriptional regulator
VTASKPPAASRPGPRSRLGLTRERILDAALDLLDREGWRQLTMRRLAEDLGVGTMTLYGYFRSKDELLDAVLDAAIEKLRPTVTGETWREQIRQVMIAMYRFLMEHPGVVEIRFNRPILTPGALKVTEAGMSLLRDGGFSADHAARAYRLLFIYTFGFAAFGPGKRPESDRAETVAALSSLPRELYPALVDAASAASESMADETLFERGLDFLLDGLERDRSQGGQNS